MAKNNEDKIAAFEKGAANCREIQQESIAAGDTNCANIAGQAAQMNQDAADALKNKGK